MEILNTILLLEMIIILGMFIYGLTKLFWYLLKISFVARRIADFIKNPLPRIKIELYKGDKDDKR